MSDTHETPAAPAHGAAGADGAASMDGAHAEDAADPAATTPPSGDRRSIRPDWWHRDHPVFGPLSGFYTGMLFIIIVPGLYGALLKAVVGYQRAEELFPFVLLTFVVPLVLLVPPRTRRFARYMLFGAVATAVVVGGVTLAVLWFLVKRAA